MLTAVICEIGGRLRAVIRVQSITTNFHPRPEIVTNFDAETVEERLGRRARTWIGSVTASRGSAPNPDNAEPRERIA